MAENIFTSDVYEKSSWVVWAAHGRLDIKTSVGARKDGEEIVTRGNKIVFDMSNLTYLSSAGIRMILYVAQLAEDDDKVFVVCAARESVKDVLELSGMAELLEMYDTLEEAISQ